MKKIYCGIINPVIKPIIGTYDCIDETETQYICIRDDGMTCTIDKRSHWAACFETREEAEQWIIEDLKIKRERLKIEIDTIEMYMKEFAK